jgi:hypothetical protein
MPSSDRQGRDVDRLIASIYHRLPDDRFPYEVKMAALRHDDRTWPRLRRAAVRAQQVGRSRRGQGLRWSAGPAADRRIGLAAAWLARLSGRELGHALLKG